jgi:LmbE family N-acetylglucosaminyl deacetylase
MDDALTLFDDSGLQRVLAVVAHPDDMEYGTAAAIAQWTRRGLEVGYVLVTSGEAGIASTPPGQAGPLRESEQREACARVGVSDLRFLGFPDGTVEYGLPLRRAIAGEVRRFRPDTIVTISFQDRWPGGMPNQSDHVAVGRAVVDAARDAGNRWVFPDLLDAGLEPWDGVRSVLVTGSPAATHGIDVTAGFEDGVKSLQAHEQYMAALGPSAPSAADVLEGILSGPGARLGTRYAVAVEVLPLHFW